MAEVLLVGFDRAPAAELTKLLKKSQRIAVATVEEAGSQAVFAAESPRVAVLGPMVGAEEALRLAQSFVGLRPECGIVLVTADPSTSLMRAAMRAGVRDVLPADDGLGETVLAVSDALAAFREPSADAPAAVEQQQRAGKVITVFGTKGGVGKSVIATNLSVALALAGHRVSLLDLDLQFGDDAVMLQLVPERTIFDAVQSFERLDAEMLGGYLVDHESGLKALLAPVRPEQAESVTASRVATIIGLLRDNSDYVVIDTPAAFNEVVLCALEKSDEILAVATMDVPSVKNVKVSLQKLQQLGLGGGRTHLVLNRADSKVGLQPSEIETATGHDIVAKVPSDRIVPRAVNKGVPVVIDVPRSPVARALTALARLASERTEEVEADVA